MPLPDLPTIVRTLVLDGFHLDSATRSVGFQTIRVHRYDRFGVSIPYSFAFFDNKPDEAAIHGLVRAAIYERRHPVIVASEACPPTSCLTAGHFFSLFGGTVDDTLIRDPGLAEHMDDLGHGRTSPEHEDDPELMLERNVSICLQFLTGYKARHWGADRRFERLPDGVVSGGIVILYDGKAYTDAYSVSADDIRRFSSYIEDFNARYSVHLGRVFSFTVVAGEFAETSDQRQRRSAELYAACSTPLCYITARHLAEMVELIRDIPQLRTSVDWRRVFAGPTATLSLVHQQLRRIQRDDVLRND